MARNNKRNLLAMSFTKKLGDGNNKPQAAGMTDEDAASIDQLSPEDLANYLYEMAEKIIEDPLAYKVEFGLSTLDIQELDNIDLSTAQGRKKLAKLFRLLAKQVFKGKNIYLETIQDKSQETGRAR
jgi:hypothetical protein